MSRVRARTVSAALISAVGILAAVGCHSPHHTSTATGPAAPPSETHGRAAADVVSPTVERRADSPIRLASHEASDGWRPTRRPYLQATGDRLDVDDHAAVSVSETVAAASFSGGEPFAEAESVAGGESVAGSSLAELEALALSSNPALIRRRQEVAAAWAKVRYVDKLPDPTIGGGVFGQPMMFADGPQRGEIEVMQMIPWLQRLDAEARQSTCEALSLQQLERAERLAVLGDLRAKWAQLYALRKEAEFVDANRRLLRSLIDLATARLGQNRGSAGDVTLLGVEIGRLEEQSLSVTQQLRAAHAEINRLAGRSAESAVGTPETLDADLPDWTHPALRDLAWARQPEIAAAHLRTQASRWGIEVARQRRRPDVSLRAAWFPMDAPGPDPWLVGAQVSVPLWREKYDALRDEATSNHFAAHASVEELQRKYDALLQDLWAQAQAGRRTADLYRETIIPQAKQTLQSDQKALAAGTVDFDRILGDVRSLLTLELAYHRALAQTATAVARIRQAVGEDWDAPSTLPTPPVPAPPPSESLPDATER